MATFLSSANAEGTLNLTVVDADSRQPIACRMHLKDSAGKPVQAPRLPFFHDHFVFPGNVTLTLPPGAYTFEIERGPEYANLAGSFTIVDAAEDAKEMALRRVVDMAGEGWWSGELHVHRPAKDIELLMQAEDLHVAPVITWWNQRSEWTNSAPPKQPLVRFDQNRFYHLLAGEDEREGGALLLLNLAEPLAIATRNREHPSPMEFLKQAKAAGGWVDIEKPFWWDVPIWLASGQVDSIGLANNHMQRSKMYEGEAWGKPRDAQRLPPPLGNGQWSQEIYYHVLNCGLRIPPSAGSASGVLHNPVGYNRAYVFVGEDFTYERWWAGLKAGRVVVTNGPLLRPFIGGKLPGHIFTAPAGGRVVLDAVLNLSTRDKVTVIEVVENGHVKHSLRVEDLVKQKGELPALVFKESGWFLIRAVTDNEKTFRFASTGPYYVQIGDQPRISRTSARFFLDWVNVRRERVKLDDPQQRSEVLKHHDAAKAFWEDLMHKANTL
jgi:hypothetical protein